MINRFNEFETCEQLEMAYVMDLGLPYELDKTNPKKVVMIVKSDGGFVQGLITELWEDHPNSYRFKRHFNVIKDIKRALWVGGQYNKDFYSKPNEHNNHRTPDQQKEQPASNLPERKDDNDSVKGV